MTHTTTKQKKNRIRNANWWNCKIMCLNKKGTLWLLYGTRKFSFSFSLKNIACCFMTDFRSRSVFIIQCAGQPMDVEWPHGHSHYLLEMRYRLTHCSMHLYLDFDPNDHPNLLIVPFCCHYKFPCCLSCRLFHSRLSIQFMR